MLCVFNEPTMGLRRVTFYSTCNNKTPTTTTTVFYEIDALSLNNYHKKGRPRNYL
jgi:hypothetical protein